MGERKEKGKVSEHEAQFFLPLHLATTLAGTKQIAVQRLPVKISLDCYYTLTHMPFYNGLSHLIGN
jgi:hypothetical protein